MDINDYRKAGKHLPRFLKDFHDQKDFFKAFYAAYAKEMEEALPAYNWRDNQIFCIDFFLWFLALHGYSIQKIRSKKVQFKDIDETVSANRERMAKMFAEALMNRQKPPTHERTT